MPTLVQLESGFHDTMREVSSSKRKAVTVGVKAETAGWELAFHRHGKTQVMLSVAGVALCERAQLHIDQGGIVGTSAFLAEGENSRSSAGMDGKESPRAEL